MLSKLYKAGEKALAYLLHSKQIHMASKNSDTSPKVQELYELCNATLTGTSPPASMAVQKISSLLDTVSPVDVGIEEEVPDDDRGYGVSGLNRFNRVGRWAQPITFVDVHECDSFTMCIFCFPTSSVIPLHDHPEMTVFSKVLYGSLHVKAYDWVDPPFFRQNTAPGLPLARLARLSTDRVLTPQSGTAVLYPKSGGNLHCFTALSPCAVLDVLTPPYQENAGRICSYYVDYPFSAFSSDEGPEVVDDGKEDDYAWLVQVETPDDLYMRPGTYVGPKIKV
ncbi:PREDICTED: plant cysteine oxidase 3 [Tarenaya hassleriana]|uniref:plant cysteine oxidase 3 n=1 Tax=Tarenaya hassleriana TaxID=28532 RepID=UPI00053C442C|nr:PREDICTED: plant cysteine oxidase 3 [Tarenaya hassleriana]